MSRDEAPKSKLIKLLQKISRGTSPRIGLVPMAEETSSAMAIVAALEQPDARLLEVASAAADAVAIPPQLFKESANGEPGTIRGLLLESDSVLTAEALKDYLDQAPDFVIAPVDKAPAALLGAPEPGKILSVDETYPAQMVRALGEMAVDAVIADTSSGATGTLTVRDLLHCRQVVDLVRRPVLITVSSRLSTGVLPTLRDMGVEGLVFRVPAGTEPDDLRALLDSYKEAIKELGKSIGRAREGGRDAILPRIGPAHAPDEEPEEEPDEE